MALLETQQLFLGIQDDGQIEVRRTRVITDDLTGEVFTRHHRNILEPGVDIDTLDPRIRQVANAVWTPKVIADFEEAKRVRENSLRAR